MIKMKIKPDEVIINMPEKLDPERVEIFAAPALVDGKKSNQICILMGEKTQDGDNNDSPFISAWLNKNQAQYIANFLLAFVNEKTIVPGKED